MSFLDILQAATPIISVAIALITLWDSHKMIENQTRPYLTLYSDFLSYKPVFVYLILRNFGQGSAYIKEWHTETDLSKYTLPREKHISDPFAHIVGTTIAPGQSIKAPLRYQDLKEAGEKYGDDGRLVFSYTYTYNRKKYTEKATVNILFHEDHANTKINSDESRLYAIASALHERNVHNL